MSCITLLTDFGTQDEYVGVMKGVILTIHPSAAIVDLCHAVPPQDIPSAARMLLAAHGYFPPNTVHVCVVDPGVGTERAILAARAGGRLFIAPDNGLLFPLLRRASADALVRVENAALFLPRISGTFHGRDIFAPVAAHLARGVSLADLGPPATIDEIIPLFLSEPRITPNGKLIGRVTGADRFGNLLTDIEARHIDQLLEKGPEHGLGTGTSIEIRVGGRIIPGLSRSYGPPDGETCLAVMGSRGVLEISVSGGSAKELLQAETGDAVTVLRRTPPEEADPSR